MHSITEEVRWLQVVLPDKVLFPREFTLMTSAESLAHPLHLAGSLYFDKPNPLFLDGDQAVLVGEWKTGSQRYFLCPLSIEDADHFVASSFYRWSWLRHPCFSFDERQETLDALVYELDLLSLEEEDDNVISQLVYADWLESQGHASYAHSFRRITPLTYFTGS
jgi:hypothetical protein